MNSDPGFSYIEKMNVDLWYRLGSVDSGEYHG